MCRSEAWLRPGDLYLVNEALKGDVRSSLNQYSVFSKSGMSDTPDDYVGRTYGVVTVICKHQPNLSLRQLKSSCDRIVPVAVCDDFGNDVQVIIGVYMPYFKRGDLTQTDIFISTVDSLQSVMDIFTSSVPVKICGDFNVQLPEAESLHKLWCRDHGFSSDSSIIYVFISNNNLVVADFKRHQQVNYTYFGHTNQTYTWIDHILSYEYDVDNTTGCVIIPEEDGNVGDHLPLKIVFDVHIRKTIILKLRTLMMY